MPRQPNVSLTQADRELFVEPLSDAERQQLAAILKVISHHLSLNGIFILCHTPTVWVILDDYPNNCSADIDVENVIHNLQQHQPCHEAMTISFSEPDRQLCAMTQGSENLACEISLAAVSERGQVDSNTASEQLGLYLQTVITIVEHIINQRRNEARISTKQRLRNILEATRAGTWEWDIISGKTHFNERWAEIVGYTLAELEPTTIETWYTFVHPDDQANSAELLQQCFTRKADYYDCECRMKHKDGSWVWIHDRGKVIQWSSQGEPVYMAGTHTDINEKKRIELALSYQANFQKLVFDNLPVYLFVKDDNYRIVSANDAFLSLYPPEKRDEVIGNTTIESFSKDEAHKFLEQDILAFASGFSEAEEQIHFPSGGFRTIWTKKIRFRDMHDDTYILGVSTDITELKRSEQAMKEAKNEAEAANRAKSEFLATMTHEIRTPINGIMGMLELASQSPSDPTQARRLSLANSSARSLLTIINDILDFSKIEANKLTLEYTPFNLDELIYRIIGEQLVVLEGKPVDLMVDMSEIPFCSVIGDEIRLGQILTNLLSNAVKFTAKGSITLSVRSLPVEASHIIVEFKVVDSGIGISESQIQTLFRPFTQADSSTTRKYGGTGLGLSICQRLVSLMKGTIAVNSEVNVGSEFIASVTLGINAPVTKLATNGVLIIAEHHPSIDMLTRQLSVWKTRYLVIDQISKLPDVLSVHQHKFDWLIIDESMCIELQRSLVSGSFRLPTVLTNNSALFCSPSSSFPTDFCHTFKPTHTLTKPFLRYEFKNLLTNTQSGSATEDDFDAMNSLTQNLTILVVEDNAINREVTVCLIEDSGYAVVEAEDGLEAVQLLKSRNDIALILMDCRMPVMDGFEATQAIRNGQAGQQYEQIPIVAFTANASTQDKQDCMRAGMNAYLSKPVVKDLLLATVNSFFMSDYSI